ncbi:MAG: hypothetical protein VX655_05640 [Candidatus Thermoplasmatota archaeon]|nr:hypothetical protein [Candidatus Thermoplasmatota archaeon]MEC8722024.1 hypothetical protein [Candidatus Thermoplasmatota archaeon]
MTHVGEIVPYYLRQIRNIDFYGGNVLGVNYIYGFLSIITCIVLLFLAVLIIRARPKNPENRFMFVLLLAEAYRVVANWYNAYPFKGSEEFLQWMSYYRVGWYFCSIMCILMYISTVSFYPPKKLDFMSLPKIKNNLYWFLPLLAGLIITALVSANGIVGTVGGAYYVECEVGSEGGPATIISYADSPPIPGSCGDIGDTTYVPNSFFIPGTSDIGKLLLITPVFSATIAMLFMRAGWKRLKDDPTRENDAIEARSLFLGFAGKAIIKGTMVFCIVFMVIRFGDFNLADVTTIITTEGETVVFTYLVLFYGFLFSILLTGMLEGFMFTYAILKNEILGIDEQLRKTFSAAIFATLGGIMLVMTSEIIEGLVPGGGLMAGFVVGIPLVVLRKPIFGAIQNFSSILMPEAFTKAESAYIEAYEIAMEDRIITDEERKFLKLQAKTLGLDKERTDYIESWYNSNLQEEE